MNDSNETTALGRHSRLDPQSSNREYWWQRFLSDSNASRGRPSGNIIGSSSEDSICRKQFIEEIGDVGYGSVTRNYRQGSENIRSTSLSNRPHDHIVTKDNDILGALVVGLDEEESLVNQERYEYKMTRLQYRKRSLIAWVVLVLFSCSYLALFGAGMLWGPTYGTDNRGTRLGQVFFFDTLFSGVKKKPSTQVLERPPPLARSILLVLRAEVTPENIAVKDMDRMLTAKGMRDAEGLGVYLQQHNIPEPDWIFVSPSERTAFTTELVRRHWASDAPVAFEDILYTLEFNDYFSFVAGLNDQFRRVMIVGHNPAILNTAKKLMKTHGIEDFPDCGLMEIRWNNLVHWREVQPSSGSSKMALDPNNNFFFSTPD